MKRSKQESSSKPLPVGVECPHPTEELFDLKSLRYDGKWMYLCPVCRTKSGTKLIVIREKPKCATTESLKHSIQRFDALFG